MRIKIICLLALSCSAAYAQTWSEDQEAALQELLAAKASRTRKDSETPSIRTKDGDVVIVAGKEGAHVAFEVDGERVNLDEIPKEMRGYSNAAAELLQTGFSIGKGQETVESTCDKLLNRMETKTDAEIADLATAVAEIGLTVTETLEAKSNELVDMVTDLSSELEGTVNKALEETSADVKANTKFIEFAQDCAANGQGVTIDKDKKLVCADTNPTAAADAECDDDNEGRVSIRAAEIGGLKLPASFVCYNKVWVSFSKQLSADAKALGLSQNTAATSCNQIKAIKPTSPNGLYWVEQNGDNGAKIQVMCIMDDKYDGGGWQLLLTLTHHQNMFHGSKHPLGFGNVNGDTPSLNNAYAKNWVDINQPAKGDDFLLINSGNLWKRMVMTFDFCGWDSTDAGVCTGGHGTYAKGQIYNEDGSKVPCGNAGCWLNSCSIAGGCLREGCDTIGFNADHSDYNYFGGGAKWKSFGSGWYGGTCGGGWGRDRRNGVFPLNLLHRTKL